MYINTYLYNRQKHNIVYTLYITYNIILYRRERNMFKTEMYTF